MKKLKTLLKSGLIGLTESGRKFTVVYQGSKKYHLMFENGEFLHSSNWNPELQHKDSVGNDIVLLIDPTDAMSNNDVNMWSDELYDKEAMFESVLWEHEIQEEVPDENEDFVEDEKAPKISVEFDVKINGEQVNFAELQEHEKAVFVSFYLKLMETNSIPIKAVMMDEDADIDVSEEEYYYEDFEDFD